jgi:hypothetical protein
METDDKNKSGKNDPVSNVIGNRYTMREAVLIENSFRLEFILKNIY